MQVGTFKQQLLSPYDWYSSMRASQPVFHDEEHKIWHVFRYADVSRVLTEYATFSSDPRTMGWEPEGAAHILSSILRMDPPRHRQLRSIATVAFTPRVVAQMESRITTITNELLDQVAGKDKIDVIADLAYPLPVTVIAELLGIPSELRADFKRWSDALVSGDFDNEESERREIVFQEVGNMYSYFTQVLEERRQSPQDDLISKLLVAEIDGQHLSDSELLGFCALLLVAGNETTTNLIGNSILSFDQYPEAIERLRATPALIPTAVEEALRYISPVKAMARFTKSETTVGDTTIGAQQTIIAWIASGNRDELQFPNADRFDVAREPNRHLGFGHGIHFCLGAPLARLEAKIALTAMLERFPGQWSVPDEPLESISSDIVFGTKNLPMVWGK